MKMSFIIEWRKKNTIIAYIMDFSIGFEQNIKMWNRKINKNLVKGTTE